MKILAPSKYWGFGLVYSLPAVARPAAALSGIPTIAREARRADSRNPGRRAVLVCVYSVQSAVEWHWRIFHLADKNYLPLLPGFRAVKRAGVTGRTQGRAGPPDPAAAGNNL